MFPNKAKTNKYFIVAAVLIVYFGAVQNKPSSPADFLSVFITVMSMTIAFLLLLNARKKVPPIWNYLILGVPVLSYLVFKLMS